MCGLSLPDPLNLFDRTNPALGFALPDPLNVHTVGPAPATPAAQPAVAPPQPQAGRMADQAEARRALAALATAGYGRAATGTMLTGPGGVPNSLLNVGRNTLLGS